MRFQLILQVITTWAGHFWKTKQWSIIGPWWVYWRYILLRTALVHAWYYVTHISCWQRQESMAHKSPSLFTWLWEFGESLFTLFGTALFVYTNASSPPKLSQSPHSLDETVTSHVSPPLPASVSFKQRHAMFTASPKSTGHNTPFQWLPATLCVCVCVCVCFNIKMRLCICAKNDYIPVRFPPKTITWSLDCIQFAIFLAAHLEYLRWYSRHGKSLITTLYYTLFNWLQ